MTPETEAERGTVVLTGGSGVVGSALLEFLDGERVVGLVNSSPIEADGVISIRGDVRERHLGLSAGDRDGQLGQVSYVVHCAAITDFMRPPEEIAETNVEGTKRVLEFAAEREAPLLYVGTAFVYHDPSSGPPPGEGDSAVARGIRAYLASKRAAERLVSESRLPTTIVRPSIVIGDSRTGVSRRFQGLVILTGLAAIGRLPILPGSVEDRIDPLPQDYVALVISELIRRRAQDGDWWLTAGDRSLTLEDAIETARWLAGELGKPAPEPRVIDYEMMDRLIRPVFLPELSPKIAGQLETLFIAAGLGIRPYRFPSSLDSLIERLSIDEPPDLGESFRRSLRYWAERTQKRGQEAPA